MLTLTVPGKGTYQFIREPGGTGDWFTLKNEGETPDKGAHIRVNCMMQQDLSKLARESGLIEPHNFKRYLSKEDTKVRTDPKGAKSGGKGGRKSKKGIRLISMIEPPPAPKVQPVGEAPPKKPSSAHTTDKKGFNPFAARQG